VKTSCAEATAIDVASATSVPAATANTRKWTRDT
jgi:hypothetical protein